ncbi:hypothetical protein CFOL_v3_35534, partial [Cephalotus follicularis]
TLIGSILSALSQVKSHVTPSLALITTSQGKFSNGFDLNWAQATGSTKAREWDGDVYAEIRKSLYAELLALLGLPTEVNASPRLWI